MSSRIEKLNSDEKIAVLLNLPGNEIVQVCQTSKTMNKICADPRYDSLWQKKILAEFGVDASQKNVYQKDVSQRGTYQKYVQLASLYLQKFYVVTVLDVDDRDVWSQIFDTRDKAIDFIASNILDYSEETNYFNIRSSLSKYDGFQMGPNIYTITEEKLVRNDASAFTDIQPLKQEYEEKMRKIQAFFPQDRVDKVVKFLSRLYEMLEYQVDLTSSEIQEIVGHEIDAFCEKLNIKECDKFIYSIL